MIQIGKCCTCGKMAKGHLLILGKIICSRCEDRIVHIETNDKGYQDYKDGLKKLFMACTNT